LQRLGFLTLRAIGWTRRRYALSNRSEHFAVSPVPLKQKFILHLFFQFLFSDMLLLCVDTFLFAFRVSFFLFLAYARSCMPKGESLLPRFSYAKFSTVSKGSYPSDMSQYTLILSSLDTNHLYRPVSCSGPSTLYNSSTELYE
jgi:hypothetical protein